MVTKTAAEKAQQAVQFAVWFDEADKAGRAAAEATGAREVGWVDQATGARFSAPVSGTAYIKVRPANHPFVRFLQNEVGWHGFRAHTGGRQFSVRGWGQAYEPSMAYATEFAKVMRAHGLSVYTDSWVN